MFFIKKLSLLSNLLFFYSMIAIDQNQNIAFSKQFLCGGDLLVQFNSNCYFDFTQNNKFQLSVHLPGFQEVDFTDRTPDLIINYTYDASCETSLQQEDGMIRIRSKWHTSMPTDFIYLFYGACRLAWIQKKIFPVHAACIGNDQNGYVLLMGLPGSGKTSLTLHNIYNNNLKVFSEDKTLITFNEFGQMEAIAGNKTFAVRDHDTSKWIHIEKTNVNTYGYRITFQPSSKFYSNLHKAPIKQIFFVNLQDRENLITEMNSLRALNTLYPFFIDKHREDVLVDGDKAFIDGACTKNIREELIHNLYTSLHNVNVYNITGSLEAMSSFILEKGGYARLSQSD